MKKLPVFVVLFFLFLAFPDKSFATSTLYFSPSSGSLSKGQNLTVYVRVNSGQENINAVSANLLYPASQFAINSVTVNESVLPVVAEKVVGGGIIKISGGSYTPFSGDKLLATVNLNVNSDVSVASLGFGEDSAVVRSGDNMNDLSVRQGASFSFVPAVSNRTGGLDKTSFAAVKSEKTVNIGEVIKIFFWKLFSLNI